MHKAEETIVNALLSYGIAPEGIQNVIERARRKSGLGHRLEDWLLLAEQYIPAELEKIIPAFSKDRGEYAQALANLRNLVRQRANAQASPTPAQPVKRPVNLEDEAERERLLAELAREEGALGVALIEKNHALMRFPGARPELPRLLYAAHRLIGRRRRYRVAYLVVKEAQVFLRPLGKYVIVVMTKRGANLGRVLTRLGELASEGGQE